MGKDYSLINDLNKLPHNDVPVINYSTDKIPGTFRIYPYGLLFESDIHDQKINEVIYNDDIPAFFLTHQPDLCFDVFSAVFYLVSRYEEYLPFDPDNHNRFPSKSSIAFKYNFLHIPVVNYWIKDLEEKLMKFYGRLKINPPVFAFYPTIDIDYAWAFRYKTIIRNIGSITKDLLKADFKKTREKLRVLTGKAGDPFYTVDEWDKIHDDYVNRIKVFILAGNSSRFDMMVSPKHKEWQKMVKTLSAKYSIGLHPSYLSGNQKNMISNEKKLLESITGNTITCSRQHYLKLRFPDTYRNLLMNGIKKDYSMGYPDNVGFRAGIAFPFPFYDLGKDENTELTIYPFMVMDRTLKDYMGLSVSQSLEIIRKLISAVKNTGGIFISVWHNDSLSNYGEWAGWDKVYIKMLELCKQ